MATRSDLSSSSSSSCSGAAVPDAAGPGKRVPHLSPVPGAVRGARGSAFRPRGGRRRRRAAAYGAADNFAGNLQPQPPVNLRRQHRLSGLGRNPDGTIAATDDWWEEKTKGHPDWKKLKGGWHPDAIDKMFFGVAADSSSSFVPGHTRNGNEDEDEEEPNEDEPKDLEAHSPGSIGSKRATSTSTTAPSPSPAVRSMELNMREHNRIEAEINQMMLQYLTKKQEVYQFYQQIKNLKTDKIMRVQQLARESGVNESNVHLWLGVHKITKNHGLMAFFIASAPAIRLKVIQHYAEVNK